MTNGTQRCPTCGAPNGPDAFNCLVCETILFEDLPDEPTPRRETTVIRRMMAPPDAGLEAPPPGQLGIADAPAREVTSPTVRVPYPQPAEGVPELLGGVDVRDRPLTVFEAFVVSRIDGRSTVRELRSVLGLSPLEITVVLGTLADKGILQVDEPEAAPVAGAPSPETQAEIARAAEAGRAARSAGDEVAARRADLARQYAIQRLMELRQARRPVEKRVSPLQEAIRREQAGDLPGAVEILERAIAGGRDPAPLYNRLAILVVKEARDFARAESLVRKALELDPGNEAYTTNLYKVLGMAAAQTRIGPRPQRR